MCFWFVSVLRHPLSRENIDEFHPGSVRVSGLVTLLVTLEPASHRNCLRVGVSWPAWVAIGPPYKAPGCVRIA